MISRALRRARAREEGAWKRHAAHGSKVSLADWLAASKALIDARCSETPAEPFPWAYIAFWLVTIVGVACLQEYLR